ncbi:tetratricopeptide repeat protein [Nocardiopsis changdeensis]|uniref:Tetratricopeptide repeat protein n=1 Tax=Nocardiopsis changdeensis TaxID=2831969 RepID=A0ABX8BNL8_9ACTN|nr:MULTISPECIES: tetratricopeptide repeat protein [Nocardiopsis]QUX23835.1 tetratricopeptide repeat protein [Nocardiopsis changdeensis]QYX39780.1 tetratricopeptide repeat protein [Nocardiopsis sp. MT53]
MDSSPGTHVNSVDGDVYGRLVQARDIHSLTINAGERPAPPPGADVVLDPPRPATAVRGREGLVGELLAEMRAGAAVPHVLTGPGGFGKTTVAAELAGRARAEGRTVFWVRPGSVAASMIEVAVELGGSRREAEEVRTTRHLAMRWVWRHLDDAPRPWLLVIDNADRPEELDPENRPGDQLGWMRASPGGFVLVTTRVDDPAQWAPARIHRVEALEAGAAASALADHAALAGTAGAEELAERLGRVPLALSLAGRILATHRVLFPDARALLARLEEGVDRLDELAAPFVTGPDVDRRLLSGVWDLSLRSVAEREPYARPLLQVLAVLGSNAVPVPLRRLPPAELASGPLEGLDDVGLARAVNALIVHGLVALGEHGGEAALRMHPLVAETVRAGIGDSAVTDIVSGLLQWRPDSDFTLEASAYTALAGVLARVHHARHPTVVQASVGRFRVAMLLGDRMEAERSLGRLVETAEAALGGTHPETLRARHAWADSLRALDRWGEAQEIYRSVHSDRVSRLGPDHPDTLSSLHQVALIAGLRGDLKAAEQGFQTVLAAYEGREEEPTALHALQNLAYIRMLRGDNDGAEAGFLRVREAWSRVLGEDHPNTGQADYFLARNAAERGDHARAAAMFDEVARTRAAAMGEENTLVVQARERAERARQAVKGSDARGRGDEGGPLT